MSTKHTEAPVRNAGVDSRLLQLPGELRNKIFEYALTIDEGIYYREDKVGVGWLCLHPRKFEEDVERLSETPAPVGRVQESDDDTPMRKRRKISETNLTTNKPVSDTKKTIHQGPVRVNGHVVANQLQFVNKKLRSETKALVIRHNDVHIVGPPEHLTKFFNSVVGKRRLWIQKIHQQVTDYRFEDLYGLQIDAEMHPRFLIECHSRGTGGWAEFYSLATRTASRTPNIVFSW